MLICRFGMEPLYRSMCKLTVYMHMHIYMCVYVYIYIYIHTYMYMYTCMYIYIYSYMYIERERDVLQLVQGGLRPPGTVSDLRSVVV